MEIKDSHTTAKIQQASTSPIQYLERQQRYLLSLSHQLKSYHCVPKTIKLYEQMERLKRSLHDLMLENDQLISGIHKSGNSSHEYVAEYQSQFDKVIQLEHEILTYIGKAKIHG
ncbi:hypothetical protein [Muriicola sp.]|uniref:hypothetical protein n=1 Tax=Muriicola sp. TaxID=2020856 RepID=UPI003C718A34